MFKWGGQSNRASSGFAAQELGQVLNNWVKNDRVAIENPKSDVIFDIKGSEMLRVAEDGFYVRGQRVPVDDREAETVYRAFREWLTWSHLARE